MRVVVLLIGSVLIASSIACRGEEGALRSSSGVVAAASPEAAEAGARILAAGGNAVDAAVAVSFALAVTEPAMSGLGGQTQMLLFRDGDGEGRVLNGTSFAPAATPENVSLDALVAHRATTIPTTVRTLDVAFRKFGSGRLSWKELLAPAIEYAEQGFLVGPFRARVFRRHLGDLRESPSAGALFLDAAGEAPLEGDRLAQPELARTLRRLAEEGADSFYRGSIARAIASDMAEHGGFLTYEDLAGLPEPRELEALHGSFRDYDVWTLPPPGGGWVLLQILNLLELSPPSKLRWGRASRAPIVARALRIGHRSRERRPVEDLLHYEDPVASRVSKERARALWEESGETTHFSIVDGAGLAVAVSASINGYFGARVASPELGFLYNNYMHEFRFDAPAHPFAPAPGRMPYSSMSPTVLARDGKARLVVGSPGSERILSAVAQVVELWVDGGQKIGGAVAAHRLHALPDGRLYAEGTALDPASATALAREGFERVEPPMDLAAGDWNPYFGGVHAVAFEDGGWHGAADPRRDGLAIEVVRD